jgi:DnaJ-domain-containing protein 1
VYVLVGNSDRKRDKQTLSKADGRQDCSGSTSSTESTLPPATLPDQPPRLPTSAWKALGLDPETAEASDIKKTYRKLCMKYHPDSNPDDEEAEAKYQEVQDAYNR